MFLADRSWHIGLIFTREQVCGEANLLGQGLKMEKNYNNWYNYWHATQSVVLNIFCRFCKMLEFICNIWLWSVCSCWGYKGKNPRVAYHFQPMYVPHIMGYDHPMPSLPTKVSGLRRGRVAKGGNFLLFEVVLPLMGWCPLWCAMVVLPVMAAINFNQNTLEREKSGLGSYMLCGCTCKSYHSRSIWQCPPIKCTIHISGLKVAKSVLVSSQSQWAPLDVSSCQWSV